MNAEKPKQQHDNLMFAKWANGTQIHEYTNTKMHMCILHVYTNTKTKNERL